LGGGLQDKETALRYAEKASMAIRARVVEQRRKVIKTFLLEAEPHNNLLETYNPELPKESEIKFILHVDGAETWSWANIRNNGSQGAPPVPKILDRNMSNWGVSLNSDD